MESKVGITDYSDISLMADVKSFAYICATLFPEYEEIPVAGLIIKHVLMGSEKAMMDRIYPILKKEAVHFTSESHQLKDIQKKPLFELYEELKNGIMEIKEEKVPVMPESDEVETEAEEITETLSENIDFDEMYSKVFND